MIPSTRRSSHVSVAVLAAVLLACGGSSDGGGGGTAAEPGSDPSTGPADPGTPPPVVPPPTVPECTGTATPTDFSVRASYFCAPAYGGLGVTLARRAFVLDVIADANGGDARLPSFAFAAPPVAGQTYGLADLARFSAALWWTRPQVDDLYMFVASKDALTPEPLWGSASIHVTSVVPPAAAGGDWEVHGTIDAQLAPHPASISLVDPRWDDPAAKLPQDATGTVHLVGSF